MPVVPDVVSVAMDQIAADVREGLLAIAVGAGLQVMAAMMAADADGVCGPRGKHDPDRSATRHGSEDGSVTLGGRRLAVRRPRVRAVDGTGTSKELPIASYEAFSGTKVLGRKAMEAMLARPVLPPLPRGTGAGRRPGGAPGLPFDGRHGSLSSRYPPLLNAQPRPGGPQRQQLS
jgi:hypothetical protein